MPPFSIMKYIKFVLDTTTQPSMADYGSLPVKEPTIFKLSDGSGAIKFDTFNSYWLNAQVFNNMFVNAEEEAPKSQQPDPGSVTEATLLKAIAISHQPELALRLVKE